MNHSGRTHLDTPRWPNRRRQPFAIGKPRTTGDRTPPDTTVVIPSYNHEAFITETLQSVLAQTYNGFRMIVVDDASPDETAQRALSVQDPRIMVKVNPSNMGLGNSILSVLGDITTPLTALLNSDDLFHPERLARCRNILLNSPETQVVATDFSFIDKDGGCLTPDNVSPLRDGRDIYYRVHWFQGAQAMDDHQIPLFARLLKYNFLATSSNIVCRTEYLRHRAEALKDLNYCLDWQLFLDASLDGQMTYVREKLVAYRLHSGNTVWFTDDTRSAYLLEANRVVARALKRFLSSLTDSQMTKPDLEKVLHTLLLHLGANVSVDAFSLYLNALSQSFEFQQTSQSSSKIREVLELLYTMAQETRFRREGSIESWIRRQTQRIRNLWKKLCVGPPFKGGEYYDLGN